MSLEFNRRSFLKYSAAAAVAVAGSSLLTGCGEDEYQKTGKIGSTLKLMGAFELESAKLTTDPSTATTGNTLTCKFNLKGTSKLGLPIGPANFQVEVTPKDSSKTVTTYHANNTDGHWRCFSEQERQLSGKRRDSGNRIEGYEHQRR